MSTFVTIVLATPAGNGGAHHGGSKSGVIPLIIGILFVVIGLVNATNPRLQWRMRSWQYKNKQAQEPSDLALTVTRVVGVPFVVIGIVLIVRGILKL